MNPNDALNILTHPSDKNILEEAIIYVEEKKLNGGN